jgi:hypothetical protein
MFMMTPLDQSFVAASRAAAGGWLFTSMKKWGCAEPISRVPVRRQFQQLIVWRAAKPRSQLIKMPWVGHADQEPGRAGAQDAI